jgi:hypothetical protein
MTAKSEQPQERVAIFAVVVDWTFATDQRPMELKHCAVVEGSAVKGRKMLREVKHGQSYLEGKAFSFRRVVDFDEMEDLGIAYSREEAVRLALKNNEKRHNELKEKVERHLREREAVLCLSLGATGELLLKAEGVQT